MLTLSESQNKRVAAGSNKRQRGKKRTKVDNKQQQKRTVLVIDNDVKDSTTIKEHEIPIHDFIPMHYKTIEDEHQLADLTHAEVTFEDATLTGQECQTVVSIPGLEGVSNSNKYVIITLLEPDSNNITGELINAEELTIEEDDKNKKLQKKVLLLHKIEQPVETIETATVEEPDQQLLKIHKINGEVDQLIAVNSPVNLLENYGPPVATLDGKADLSNWVKKFDSLTLLYTESGKPFVKCPACTAMFFKASSFEKHVSCHLSKEDDLYICNYCKFMDSDPNPLFTHMVIHQDQCEVCNFNLTRKNSFKKHMDFAELQMTFNPKRDRWGRFICVCCKLAFDLCHQLQKHWYKHSCMSKKTSQCKDCAGIFDTDEALQNHVCLKCPVCGKICDSVHRLRSHTRYEKHYLYCQICTYQFILSVDHDKHMELHKKIYHDHKDYAHCLESEDGSSFQCELCGKIYHTISTLLVHIHDDHKIEDTSRTISEDDLARISIPEVKDATASYEIIHSLKSELKCEVDFQRACEEVLVVQDDERTVGKSVIDGESIEIDEQCEPIALCWNRYSMDDETVIAKTA